MKIKFDSSVVGRKSGRDAAEVGTPDGGHRTNFAVIAEQLPDDLVARVEEEADNLDLPIHGNDPYNQVGMMEAEEIATFLREQGGVVEPFLLLAFENRQDYADVIWEALLQKADEYQFERVDGRKCAVIAAADVFHANLLHATMADVLNLPGYMQVQDGKPAFVRRDVLELN